MKWNNRLLSRKVKQFRSLRISIVAAQCESCKRERNAYINVGRDASWQSMHQSVHINFCRTSRGMNDRWGAFHSATPDISRIIELRYKPPPFHIFQISRRTCNARIGMSRECKTHTLGMCLFKYTKSDFISTLDTSRRLLKLSKQATIRRKRDEKWTFFTFAKIRTNDFVYSFY